MEIGFAEKNARNLPPPLKPADGRSGFVMVRVVFDEKGKVIHSGATGGNPVLQAAAREAACRAKFEPIVTRGQLIKATGVVTYNFHYNTGDDPERPWLFSTYNFR
jgi:TonB family protein